MSLKDLDNESRNVHLALGEDLKRTNTACQLDIHYLGDRRVTYLGEDSTGPVGDLEMREIPSEDKSKVRNSANRLTLLLLLISTTSALIIVLLEYNRRQVRERVIFCSVGELTSLADIVCSFEEKEEREKRESLRRGWLCSCARQIPKCPPTTPHSRTRCAS